jgi:toxin ParE1/3/4
VARRVVWTAAARRDLEAAADYIAADSARYAAAFVGEVRDAASSLAHFSPRGRVVPEFGNPSLRELLVRNYRLIYRVTAEAASVIAFVHGARDLMRLWGRERVRPEGNE